MATKDTKGKRTGSPRGKKAADSEPIFDRRLMERQMASLTRVLQEHEFASVEEANEFLQNMLATGSLPEPASESPLERAQDLIYQAIEATGQRRAELVRKALSVSSDCADAYVLLAEDAKDIHEAQRLFEEGMRAGERALGPEVFEEMAGEFWGIIETRPYMRARQGLAGVLWSLGEREAAIGHAQDMLRLNPGDNQGMRYQLASWLLTVSGDTALDHLLAQYPDDWSAYWAYTAVLHMFRQHGPGPEAEDALRHALEVNPFVPMYLVGMMLFPKEMPAYYGMGDTNEAVIYVAEAAEAWMGSPDAVAWMIEAMVRLTPPPPARRSKPRAKRKGTGASTRSTREKKP